MRIEAHNKLGQPISAEVTRVVIYNDFNQPVAVAVKIEHGWIYTAHCKDPEFFDFLKAMGIDATYVVETLNTKDLPKIDIR